MSHFTVMVFGDDVESLLEPYNENKEVPEYARKKVSEKEKEDFINYYIKKDENLKNLTFDELYKLNGSDWNDNTWRYNSEGVLEEFSTYNPDSKWDWYSEGGRWDGFFKLKNGKRANKALKKDIDFNAMKESIKEDSKKLWNFVHSFIKDYDYNLYTTWNDFLKKENLTIEEKRERYNNQDLVKAFNKAIKNKKDQAISLFSSVDEFLITEEEYINREMNSAITPFALINENRWFEKGSMGWWGMTFDEKDTNIWNDFFNKVLSITPDNTMITMIDCHI